MRLLCVDVGPLQHAAVLHARHVHRIGQRTPAEGAVIATPRPVPHLLCHARYGLALNHQPFGLARFRRRLDGFSSKWREPIPVNLAAGTLRRRMRGQRQRLLLLRLVRSTMSDAQETEAAAACLRGFCRCIQLGSQINLRRLLLLDIMLERSCCSAIEHAEPMYRTSEMLVLTSCRPAAGGVARCSAARRANQRSACAGDMFANCAMLARSSPRGGVAASPACSASVSPR